MKRITHRLCKGEPCDGPSLSFSQQNQDCLINVNFFSITVGSLLYSKFIMS